jgi:hypothetical protein
VFEAFTLGTVAFLLIVGVLGVAVARRQDAARDAAYEADQGKSSFVINRAAERGHHRSPVVRGLDVGAAVGSVVVVVDAPDCDRRRSCGDGRSCRPAPPCRRQLLTHLDAHAVALLLKYVRLGVPDFGTGREVHAGTRGLEQRAMPVHDWHRQAQERHGRACQRRVGADGQVLFSEV